MDNPINPVKTVASLKVWHLFLLVFAAGAAFLGLCYVLSNYVFITNVISSPSGEVFHRTSFLKPIKAADAVKIAERAVAGKPKKDEKKEATQ